jgi:hypothetical protein
METYSVTLKVAKAQAKAVHPSNHASAFLFELLCSQGKKKAMKRNVTKEADNLESSSSFSSSRSRDSGSCRSSRPIWTRGK